jgi:polyhydroxybutyrate depolymerase
MRTYLVHIPPSYNKESLTPLVIALHGGGGDGKKAEKSTLMSQQSDKDGFILVYPDAVRGHWNDGRGVKRYRSHREDIDDVGFISSLIDVLAEDYNIDRTRVYVTGISNGGLMSNRLACELTDKITAIAPVIGSIAQNVAARCLPTRPIPVLMINGMDDPMVPWEGEYVRVGRKKLGKILSIPNTVNFWVSHNGCSPKPEITWEPDIDPEDGTRVRKIVYGKCKDGVEVVLYEIQGGGHTWPRGPRYLPEFIVGKTSQDIDANQTVWRFFKQFRR